MTSPVIQHPNLSLHGNAINQNRWFEYYRILIKNTDRQQRLKECMEQGFKSQVVNPLHTRVAGQICDDEPLRVLGIGSAEGYQEMLQLKNLTSRFPKLTVYVIEPNKDLIQQYQETVRQTSQDNEGFASHVDYHWYNETFQDYIKKQRAAQKYHFISAVHSIYYIWDGDLGKTIRELYEMLEPGGTLFMVVWTAHTGMPGVAKLAKKLQSKMTEHDSAANDGSSICRNRPTVTSEEVKAILDKHQITYVQSEYTESTDITTCFTEEDSSTGRHLLDLVTQIMDFKNTVSNEVFNQVMDFVKDQMRVANCKATGEQRFYCDNVSDILVISKQ